MWTTALEAWHIWANVWICSGLMWRDKAIHRSVGYSLWYLRTENTIVKITLDWKVIFVRRTLWKNIENLNLIEPISWNYHISLWQGVLNTTGQWFSPGTLVSSTNNTDCHDINEILLKMALNTITLTLFLFFLEEEYIAPPQIKAKWSDTKYWTQSCAKTP